MTYTPGPNNIMVMNNSKNVGFKKNLKFALGMFTGFLIIILLCLVFSTVLFNIVPAVQFPMKILGAAYMAYLIIKTFFSSKKEKSKSFSGSYFAGIMLQFINPKLFIYGLTTISSFLLPHFKEIPILLLFSLFMSIVGFSSLLCWSLFGSLFSIVFEKHGKILNILMAALLLYCIISLFR
jgi:threonine/homoserine/homoserine lactone efflux protein